MDALYRFVFSLGSGLCHQLPERSFIFQGLQLPLCARCTGIYFGFIFTFVMLAVLYGRAPRRGGLSRFYYLMIAIFGLPLVFDGLSSYLGYRTTTNAIRLWSGSAFGAVLAVPIYYLICDALLKNASSEKVLGDWPARIGLVLSVVVTYLFVALVAPLVPLAVSLFAGICVVAVFTLVAAALVGMLPWFERSVDSLKSALLPGLLSLLGGSLILLGTWLLQTWIHRIAGL